MRSSDSMHPPAIVGKKAIGRPAGTTKTSRQFKANEIVQLEFYQNSHECLADGSDFLGTTQIQHSSKWVCHSRVEPHFGQLAQVALSMLNHTKAIYLMKLDDGAGWLVVLFARSPFNYDVARKSELNEKVNFCLFGGKRIVHGQDFGLQCTQSNVVRANVEQQPGLVFSAAFPDLDYVDNYMDGKFLVVQDGRLVSEVPPRIREAYDRGIRDGVYNFCKTATMQKLIHHLVLYAGSGVKTQLLASEGTVYSLEAYTKCYDIPTHIRTVLDSLWGATLRDVNAHPALRDSAMVSDVILRRIGQSVKRELQNMPSLTQNMINIQRQHMTASARPTSQRTTPLREALFTGVLQDMIAKSKGPIDFSELPPQHQSEFALMCRHFFKIYSRPYDEPLPDIDNNYQQMLIFGPSGTGKSAMFATFIERLPGSCLKICLEGTTPFSSPSLANASVAYVEELEFSAFRQPATRGTIKQMFDIKSDYLQNVKFQHVANVAKGQHCIASSNADFLSNSRAALMSAYGPPDKGGFTDGFQPLFRRCSTYLWAARRQDTFFFANQEGQEYQDSDLHLTILVIGFLMARPAAEREHPKEFRLKDGDEATLVFPNPWIEIHDILLGLAGVFAQRNPLIRSLLQLYLIGRKKNDFSYLRDWKAMARAVASSRFDALVSHYSSYSNARGPDDRLPWSDQTRAKLERVTAVLNRLYCELMQTEDAQTFGHGVFLLNCPARVFPNFYNVDYSLNEAQVAEYPNDEVDIQFLAMCSQIAQSDEVWTGPVNMALMQVGQNRSIQRFHLFYRAVMYNLKRFWLRTNPCDLDVVPCRDLRDNAKASRDQRDLEEVSIMLKDFIKFVQEKEEGPFEPSFQILSVEGTHDVHEGVHAMYRRSAPAFSMFADAVPQPIKTESNEMHNEQSFGGQDNAASFSGKASDYEDSSSGCDALLEACLADEGVMFGKRPRELSNASAPHQLQSLDFQAGSSDSEEMIEPFAKRFKRQ